MNKYLMGFLRMPIRLVFLAFLLVSVAWIPVDLIEWVITGRSFMVYDRAVTWMWFVSSLILGKYERTTFWRGIYTVDAG